MQITNQITTNRITPSFRMYSEHRSDVASYNYWTTTKFFRDDLNWNNFVFMMHNKYKDVDKVNVQCFACSDGEEPFSLAMKLDAYLNEKSAKFFPIVAKDFDKTNIYYAKKGVYEVRPAELCDIERECNMRMSKYITVGNAYRVHPNELYSNNSMIPVKIKNNLREKVLFKHADILKDVKNIPKSNTVLMTRNMWPYLPAKKQVFLAKELAKQLDESSLIVLGHFEISQGTHKLLEEAGFEMTEIYGIMCKKAKKFLPDEFSDAKIMFNKIKVLKK